MNPTVVGLIVFGCTLGGALVGIWLRQILPDHHVSEESKDTVKVGIGLIATMTALVLGLVTASAKSSFDEVDANIKSAVIDILTLDRQLARYGPETAGIRRDLADVLKKRLAMLWPEDPSQPVVLAPAAVATAAEGIATAIGELQPGSEAQRSLRTRALELAEKGLQLRWVVLASANTSIPTPLLAVLLFWLTITFTSFGLFAPGNGTVLAVFFVCAASVGSAVFLILEMGEPFEGLVKVAGEPLRYALAQLDHSLLPAGTATTSAGTPE